MATASELRKRRRAAQRRKSARRQRRSAPKLRGSILPVEVSAKPFSGVTVEKLSVKQIDEQLLWAQKEGALEAKRGKFGPKSQGWADKVTALNELRRIKAAKPSPGEANRELAKQATSVVVGLGMGVALSHGLETRYNRTIVSTNNELRKLAAEASKKSLTKAGSPKKLSVVAARDVKAVSGRASRVKVPVSMGRAGLIIGGGLLAEAAYSHFSGREKTSSTAGKGAVDTWTATNVIASGAAIAHSLVAGGSPKVQVDQKALGTLQSAAARADAVLKTSTFSGRLTGVLGDRIIKAARGEVKAKPRPRVKTKVIVKTAKPIPPSALKGAQLASRVSDLQLPKVINGTRQTAQQLRIAVGTAEHAIRQTTDTARNASVRKALRASPKAKPAPNRVKVPVKGKLGILLGAIAVGGAWLSMTGAASSEPVKPRQRNKLPRGVRADGKRSYKRKDGTVVLRTSKQIRQYRLQSH